MKLWHFFSVTLGGFYASDVYALGTTKKEAVEAALKGFDNHVKAIFNEYGYYPFIEDLFNEEGKADAQTAKVRRLFRLEAAEKLKDMGSAHILIRI